jgi:hypothetical protein
MSLYRRVSVRDCVAHAPHCAPPPHAAQRLPVRAGLSRAGVSQRGLQDAAHQARAARTGIFVCRERPGQSVGLL